jgi:thymidylate synthase (FAD)
MKVLDKGEVSLLNFMGGDLAVVAAARVSNGVDYTEASKGPEADEKLIRYLVKHRHGTPFEHSTFQFYVKTPLFVRSEWHRHRIASYNEISGRYVVYEPEFYIPDLFRVPAQTNKQGSVYPDDKFLEGWKAEHPFLLDTDDKGIVTGTGTFHGYMRRQLRTWTRRAYDLYEWYIAQGVAKEMARMVLPPNLYTQFYFTVNARSLMNFLSLRCAEDAQWEIRQYALAIRDMFAEKMPLTYAAWVDNNYVVP